MRLVLQAGEKAQKAQKAQKALEVLEADEAPPFPPFDSNQRPLASRPKRHRVGQSSDREAAHPHCTFSYTLRFVELLRALESQPHGVSLLDSPSLLRCISCLHAAVSEPPLTSHQCWRHGQARGAHHKTSGQRRLLAAAGACNHVQQRAWVRAASLGAKGDSNIR